ncbi:MAG: xanthine dehydrogenase accessory protein XdhC, partial [Nitratireductor sp.]
MNFNIDAESNDVEVITKMRERQNTELHSAKSLLAGDSLSIVVRIIIAKGSTPREQDAVMIVSSGETFGSIGGGKLEWLAMKKARELIETKSIEEGQPINQSVSLGPEIDQCCGGHVELEYTLLTKDALEALLATDLNMPHIYVFGAGHVGAKLVKLFAQLPVHLKCIDTRKPLLEGVSEYCETICTALPEAQIKEAPSNSVFIVTTNEHQLDFLLTAEALAKKDAAYVGMIGS